MQLKKVKGVHKMGEGKDYKLLIKNGELKFYKDGVYELIGSAIYVKSVVVNIDTDEVKVKTTFKNKGRKITKLLRRDNITKSGIKELTRYGAGCWDDVAEMYVEYFRNKLEKVDEEYYYSNVGWGNYNNKEFFRLNEAIGFEAKYSNSKYDLKPKGIVEEWINMVKNEVLPNKWLVLILCVGLSAPLVKVIGDKEHMESLLFNICGTSSTGKTTAAKLAVSAFGLPTDDMNGLIKSWYTTDQSLLTDLGGNFGIPIVIDDTSTADAAKDFTQAIYQLAAGKEKNALNSDGTKRSQSESDTTIILTSEKSIFGQTDNKTGLKVRLIEINEPKITSSAENAETIERTIMQNYGHAGIKYIKNIVDNGKDKIYSRWIETKKEIIGKVSGDNLFKRIAGKLALIRLAGELANEALDLGIDIEALTDDLIYMENKAMQTRDEGEKAYNHILGYFQSNQSKFFKDKDPAALKYKGEIIGKYIQVNGKIKEIRIPTEQFRKLMERGNFNIDQVVELWKKKDILIHDEKKNTLTRIFKPGMPKTAQYVIKIKETSDVKEEDITEKLEEEMQNKIAKTHQEYDEKSYEEDEYHQDQMKEWNKSKPNEKAKKVSRGKVLSIKKNESYNDEYDEVILQAE